MSPYSNNTYDLTSVKVFAKVSKWQFIQLREISHKADLVPNLGQGKY